MEELTTPRGIWLKFEQLDLTFSFFFSFFEFDTFFGIVRRRKLNFVYIICTILIDDSDLTGNFVSNVAYWQYAYIVRYVAYRVITPCIRIL